jgi:hypothetical protein
MWGNEKLAHPARSLDRARAFLREAGFTWSNGPNGESTLQDSDGKPVKFSVLTSSSNADRAKMAALVQYDLKQLGMDVQVVPLEFRSLLDRVTQTREYEACVMGCKPGRIEFDINVWLSTVDASLESFASAWHSGEARRSTVEEQMSARTFAQRKTLCRAQEILREPTLIFGESPLFWRQRTRLNFHPAVLEPYVSGMWTLYLHGVPEASFDESHDTKAKPGPLGMMQRLVKNAVPAMGSGPFMIKQTLIY